ncbi:hypothetical protein DPMN_035594 [Dreissena polymorpha]|uniref:Uncharacterized protein n=1 Tax=Dreissena polymorpha TaxID=45954 RepID=A0A9D4M935_DREPO|nr:hypothetical protein DPMN_035594 [Dreissena polymorpha]
MHQQFFQQTRTIFKLIQDIIRTNFLTKFHEDWIINVTFRDMTRKNTPLPGGHIFSTEWTPQRYNKKKIVLTKFHEDWTINATSNIIGTNHLTEFNLDWTLNRVS